MTLTFYKYDDYSTTGFGSTLLLVLLGLILIAPPAEATNSVYKYREDGSVVYQDRPSASNQDDGHSVLNEQGVTLREVPSRDERLRLRAAKEAARRAEIRDRALLATFSTEEDLIRTRDDRIGMIDGLVNRLDDRIRILSERLATIDSRIDAQETATGTARDSLYDERQSILRNIENAWSLVDAKAAERTSLMNKFKDDLARYRELKKSR
ncbi:MAG: hypothetical protein KDJ38_17335 [Gammaproteobacteria bacterium]|nr:hypothetical protein [Gammaproteobacteria bacterium]